MTQKARTDIATHEDGPGVSDCRGDDARGVGNLFGRLSLEQVRELVDRTADWPAESVVDLNNTDGGSTLLVCRPESGSPTQGLETGGADAAAGQPAVSNETRVPLVHMLMQQVWDSSPNKTGIDTLAVARGILRNTELLGAIVAYHRPPRAYVLVTEKSGELSQPMLFDERTQANTAQGIAAGYAEPGEEFTVYSLTDVTEEPADGQ